MNAEMNNAPQPNENKKQLFALPRAVIKNWPWKLLSVFLAICLWAGLITQDPSLTRERVFTDVPLSVAGTDTLRRNGFIVISGLEEENLRARLRVDVPQREYNTVSSLNYNPRVELSRITATGEQEIKTYATSTTAYGSVQDISPAAIKVVVDEYVTNYRIPVSVNVTGEYPEGFYGGAFTRDPSLVAVSGPKSLVDQVARIYVDYDASLLKAEAGEVSTALPMRLVDRDGKEIKSDLLEITSSGVVLRSIIVEQNLYAVREMTVSELDLITGKPAYGYEVTGVAVSPNVLRAAGNPDTLEDLMSLFVEEAVDVEGMNETFTETLRIRKPSELPYLNATTVDVTVMIEPVIISREFPSLNFRLRGVNSGLRVSTDTSHVSVVVTGPQLVVENLRSSKISAYVDVSMLGPDEYLMPVEFHVDEVDDQELTFASTPATVTVNISEN